MNDEITISHIYYSGEGSYKGHSFVYDQDSGRVMVTDADTHTPINPEGFLAGRKSDVQVIAKVLEIVAAHFDKK